MKKILITGATGMIGQELVKACHSLGYTVNYLSTSKNKLENKDNYKGFYWNPDSGELDTRCFEGVSQIINLAGAPIAKRWTKGYRQEILDSRIKSTELLYNSLSGTDHAVERLISASAIGIYPSSLTNYYEEEPTPDATNFISEVVSEWEKSAYKFKELDIDVNCLRIGLVLSPEGGVLEKISVPVRNYIGSGLGSGKQWQSWIHIDDLVGIFMFCLQNKVKGTVNAVAPNPVNHDTLVKEIADALGRPIILPNVPTWLLKIVLGEMHVIITEGQRVSSNKIEAMGYNFKFHHLAAALQDLLQ